MTLKFHLFYVILKRKTKKKKKGNLSHGGQNENKHWQTVADWLGRPYQNDQIPS